MMRKLLILHYISFGLFLTGCAMHKVDVQQGNIVTQEMLDQLELDMHAKKVRFIMGTPMMVDAFHQQRWDYIYSIQPGGNERKQRHLSLFFDENQKLTRIEGDVKIGKPHQPKPVPLPGGFDQDPIL
ncbi:outer membrane protein assembly factor BamE [Candidatus Parabeggiatoa sp. HSG14]|uniref:outer membrane protein assembly factor BamE n=1 Tax=Candidatus Parabeggiatoa sp. HSG14 TaxID=3055593 RepID=UPI0025A7713B|nr:outer membrane protein assembly factor BamE [Thiotrichales bacterium HSG14]